MDGNDNESHECDDLMMNSGNDGKGDGSGGEMMMVTIVMVRM